MMARLDSINHRGEFNGGTSDPRLIRRLQDLVPDRPITKEEEKRVRELIRYYGHDIIHQETLVRMIFGTDGEAEVAA